MQCFMWCNLFICGIARSTRHSQDLKLMWQVLLMFSQSRPDGNATSLTLSGIVDASGGDSSTRGLLDGTF